MPFAIDPVCGRVVDPKSSGLQVTANGIAFPFCSEKCVDEFKRNKLAYLYCPWKPKTKINPSISTSVYGKTIYFCCAECRDNARVFVAIQTNEYGFLGVRIKIDQIRARQNLDNFAVVTEVLSDSPAERFGIKKGSMILRIDGKDMNDYRKYFMWMRLSESGQDALFELETPDGTISKVRVVLGQRGSNRGSFVN